jgi:hypothetical protein
MAVKMNLKKPLCTLAVASTDFSKEAYWDGQGTRPAIRFGYVKDRSKLSGGIEFVGVRALRTRAESCCTTWHIDDAYDTLLEIEDSEWIEEIRTQTDAMWRDKLEMHHYMIYLDSVGCFEIIAKSWAVLPDIEQTGATVKAVGKPRTSLTPPLA